jgi:hypothetical protein
MYFIKIGTSNQNELKASLYDYAARYFKIRVEWYLADDECKFPLKIDLLKD